MYKKLLTLFILLLSGTLLNAQTGWTPVTSFGTNPGNLTMYSYVPTGISSKAPLVVALHGCLENATIFAAQSGWNTLADNHKFYVVYPKQNSANNADTCFNWFVPGDITRNQGEAYSIKQMVDYMKAHYTVDTTRIFVTGLSAGACMTSVMLACYPDIFSAGAVMAGAPFKAAENATDALYAMEGYITNTPAAWGDSVKTGYPTYTGPYPRVAVYQGSADYVVSPTNETEVMKQWTNVLGASQNPANTINSFNGDGLITKNIYNNSSGNEVVETYTITDMPHGIALDTGECYQQGGQTGTYAIQVGLFSSFWAAYFFNILNNNAINVAGLTTVTINQTGVTYSVTSTASTSYTWSVPVGASIASGQGTNQITVNFGSTSGNVSVTETNSVSCKVGPLNLFVTVGATTEVNQLGIENAEFRIYPNPISTGILNLEMSQFGNLKMIDVEIINIFGEKVYENNYQVSTSLNYQIDVSELQSGVYFMKTNQGTQKFIKQ